MVPFISLVGILKHVVGITKHVVTIISAFSFTMLLLDRILTHIFNHLSNTSYHLQYLYCQGGYGFGAKPNLITCVAYIFLSVETLCNNYYWFSLYRQLNICRDKTLLTEVSTLFHTIPPREKRLALFQAIIPREKRLTNDVPNHTFTWEEVELVPCHTLTWEEVDPVPNHTFMWEEVDPVPNNTSMWE